MDNCDSRGGSRRGVSLAAAYKRDNALPLRVFPHFPTAEWKTWSDNERRAWLKQRLQPHGLDDDKIEHVLKNIGDELGRSGQAFSSPPPRDTTPQWTNIHGVGQAAKCSVLLRVVS